MKQYEQQYSDGLITKGEKYNKVVDAWQRCSDQVAEEMMQAIQDGALDARRDGRYQQPNSIWMMAHSGARGSAGADPAAGRHARPDGQAVGRDHREADHLELQGRPDVLEYFNSTHGARKGLADTALKTANSGYLTRRLVDVAQDCIIVEEDCGTERGITDHGLAIDGGEVEDAGRAHPRPDRGRGRARSDDRRAARAAQHA